MKKFQIAIIGPGSICRTYGNALKSSKTVALKAICGRATEKGRSMSEAFPVPYYTDQDLMYEKERPDAVLICTPTFTHEEMVEKALAHQAHIMCEKPFVLDSQTARRLFDKANALQTRLMVMQVVRFWPEYDALAKLIREGRDGTIGQIKNVYINRLSSHPDWATWHRDPKKSGGGLYDLHIHDIDYLYSVFGKVDSVYAVGAREQSGCWNNVSTVLRFACGVSAVAEGFMDMTGRYEFTSGVRVNGDRASAEYQNKTGRLMLYEADAPARTVDISPYNPYQREVEYFADCVLNQKETTLVPDEDVISVLNILDAIRRSLETGQPVYL